MQLTRVFGDLFSAILGTRPEPIPVKKTKKTTRLSTQDQELSDQVTDQLTGFFNKSRTELSTLPPGSTLSSAAACGSKECALMFRQTKSWTVVDKMLNSICTVDKKTLKWIEIWRTQINGLRDAQAKVREYAQTLKECRELQLKVKPDKKGSVDEQIATLQARAVACANGIDKQSEVISKKLKLFDKLIKDHAKTDIVSLNDACNNVINYIKNHWMELTVFANWGEVSLDDEKIALRVHRLREIDRSIPLKSLLSPATLAVFLIRETEHEPHSFEYHTSRGLTAGTRYETVEIDVADRHLAPASPHPKAHIIDVTDDILFGVPLDPASSRSMHASVAKSSERARRIDRIVRIALAKVNANLAANNSGRSIVGSPMQRAIIVPFPTSLAIPPPITVIKPTNESKDHRTL